MVYGLAAIFSRIDDCAIALRESFGARDFSSGPMQVAKQRIVLLPGMSDGGDVLPRDNKDVHRRLRLDVGEGVAVLILVDRFGGDTSIYDLAEYAAHGEESTGARILLSADAEELPFSGELLSGFEEAMDGFSEFVIEGSNPCERYFDEPVPA